MTNNTFSKLGIFVAILFSTAMAGFAQQTADAYYKLGIENYNAKKYVESQSALSECIRLEPKNTECIYKRALLRSLYIGYGLALEDYNTLAQLLPDNHIVLTARGGVYYSLKRLDEALADFNKAILLKPEYADAYYQRGNFYGSKGDDDKALADYSQAIRFDPNSRAAYSFRGEIYKRKGDLTNAIADYTNAIRIDPKDAYSMCYRGEIYFQQGKKDLAEVDFKKALELDPSNKVRIDNIKSRESNKKRLDSGSKTSADLSKAIEVDAANTSAYANMEKNNYDGAIADFSKAIALEPNNAWAYTHRARAYLAKGDLAKSEADYTKAIPLYSSKLTAASITCERAEIYYKKGNYKLALSELDKALLVSPSEAYGFLIRGKVHLQLGKRALAKADFEKAVQISPVYKAALDELSKLTRTVEP